MVTVDTKVLTVGSDGLLLVDMLDVAGQPIDPATYQFRFEIYSGKEYLKLPDAKALSDENKQVISFDGTERKGNRLVDGRLYFMINRYLLDVGSVYFSQYEYHSDADFAEEKFYQACHGKLSLKVKSKGCNDPNEVSTLTLYAMSFKGEQGDKGEAFKYEDFTTEQLASLKGEKGDAFVPTDDDLQKIADKVDVSDKISYSYVGDIADFNDYNEVGIYGIITNNNTLNRPTDGYHNWALEVLIKSNSWVVQRATRREGDDMVTYVREFDGTDSSDWVLTSTVIESISVNGQVVKPDANKKVSITVPTKASDVGALPDTTIIPSIDGLAKSSDVASKVDGFTVFNGEVNTKVIVPSGLLSLGGFTDSVSEITNAFGGETAMSEFLLELKNKKQAILRSGNTTAYNLIVTYADGDMDNPNVVYPVDIDIDYMLGDLEQSLDIDITSDTVMTVQNKHREPLLYNINSAVKDLTSDASKSDVINAFGSEDKVYSFIAGVKSNSIFQFVKKTEYAYNGGMDVGYTYQPLIKVHYEAIGAEYIVLYWSDTFGVTTDLTIQFESDLSDVMVLGKNVVDSGFITSTVSNLTNYYTKSEVVNLIPTVSEWALASTKPSYTAIEVGALPDTTELFDGDYNSLDNKPTIPSVEGLATEQYVTEKISEIEFPEGSEDAVKYTPQELTEAEKAQARLNIGAYGSAEDDFFAYGIQFDTTISSPTCLRIGNLSMHRTLPIHTKMRGCLLDDDGEVVEYLTANDWDAHDLSGNSGQVMVEIPKHYRKCVTDGTVRQVLISEYPLAGYHLVPKMYVSAYEASLQRSTSKLASVMNLDADYRGGNNNADWDNTYRSLLGRPASNISLTNSRTCARNRNANSTKWNCVTYGAHKTIFWLFTVEYATLNCQTAVNAELTTDGYKQGGLGNGVTTLSSTQWSNFNGYYPFVPCGHTNALGNSTGEVAYNMVDENGDAYATIYSNRYRGIENPFGHIWQWTDGILVDVRTDDYDGNYAGQNRVLVAPDPANFASHSTLADTYEGYEFRGLQARTSSSYIKEIIFGEYGDMMGEVVGGSSTTFFCDYNYTSVTSSSMRGVRFGGDAYYGSNAGLACSYSHLAPSRTAPSVGSRLCFIPAE